MKYFFILGNNPGLSVAEICSKFKLVGHGSKQTNYDWVDRDVFVLETEEEIDATELIRKMGGVIKIGEIISKIEEKELKTEIIKLLEKKKNETAESRFKFGISFYGKDRFRAKDLAMEIKKQVKEYGLKCKWAGGLDKNLSSVAVEKNKLTIAGVEIVLFKAEKKDSFFIGKTLAVQPFESLSFRDYGRPARDDFSGMIPPKLAQIMLNLAQIKNEKAVILDPFCGSGTILTEGMLMGYENLVGTDVSEKAIADTKKNIQWMKDNYNIGKLNIKIYQGASDKVSKIIAENSIDTIITEPFLGPQRGRHNRSDVAKNLEQMYRKALREFHKILKPKGIIVMVWPVFVSRKDFHQNLKFLFVDTEGFLIEKVLPERLAKNPRAKLNKRGSIIYGRKGQKVWREIVVLRKVI